MKWEMLKTNSQLIRTADEISENKKKASNIEDTDGALEDTKVSCFYDSDEERPLEEGERAVEGW